VPRVTASANRIRSVATTAMSWRPMSPRASWSCYVVIVCYVPCAHRSLSLRSCDAGYIPICNEQLEPNEA
jgi:hypothetical protein